VLNPLEKNVRGANQRIDIICITERYKKENTLKSHRNPSTPPSTNHTNGAPTVQAKSNQDIVTKEAPFTPQIKRNKCNVIFN